MKNLNKYIAALLGLLLLTACVSEDDLIQPTEEEELTEETTEEITEGPFVGLKAPDDFSYETTNNVLVNLQVPTSLKDAVFTLYSRRENADSIAVAKATFDNSGIFSKHFVLDAQVDSIQIISNYIGLIDDIRIPVIDHQASFDYRPLYDRNVPLSDKGSGASNTDKGNLTGKTTDYSYIDTFNSWGVPDNMAFPDVIEQNLLDDINASLPEYVNGGIPVSHPEYLAGVETNLVLTKEADVWVTFVAEGAGYRNAIGYYTYPLGQEPQTIDDIAQHNIIFPNASMAGSGGGLYSGDRVNLGRFPANTVISWYLVANGWNWGSVHSTRQVYYSNPDFNPESSEAKRTHMVLLYDEGRDLTLLGFEDLRRDVSSDDDFNDAVFYAKSNPVDAIYIGNLAELDTSNDEDGDGINDELDDFPYDPNKAFNNYSPSENSAGKLAYEDLWPNLGDYDFNDLVLDYTYNLVANSDNLITQINATYTVSNIGGYLKNGFGITLPIDPSNISGITGQIENADFLDLAQNGTENGTLTNESVVFVFGNSLELEGQTIELTIDLTTPVSADVLGDIPFNPFLVANGERSKEIHLPDLPPTSKGGYLGLADDYSDPSVDRYYKSKTNLPWALNIYDGFTPPPESVPIPLQYPRFINWANSGGVLNLDWYVR